LRETEKKLTEIVNNNINKALEDMKVMMERMKAKKDKHYDDLNKERRHHRDPQYQKKRRRGVVILAIVIPIHHPLNIIISIKL